MKSNNLFSKWNERIILGAMALASGLFITSCGDSDSPQALADEAVIASRTYDIKVEGDEYRLFVETNSSLIANELKPENFTISYDDAEELRNAEYAEFDEDATYTEETTPNPVDSEGRYMSVTVSGTISDENNVPTITFSDALLEAVIAADAGTNIDMPVLHSVDANGRVRSGTINNTGVRFVTYNDLHANVIPRVLFSDGRIESRDSPLNIPAGTTLSRRSCGGSSNICRFVDFSIPRGNGSGILRSFTPFRSNCVVPRACRNL